MNHGGIEDTKGVKREKRERTGSPIEPGIQEDGRGKAE